jgi:four helix bundle protein
MKDLCELQVWHKAHALTLEIYRATKEFPATEKYGLTSQLRRSASSVPAKIAEGCGRDTAADLKRFLQIAMGSAPEVEYQLLLAHDLGLLGEALFDQLTNRVQEVKRMLAAFITKLRAEI